MAPRIVSYSEGGVESTTSASGATPAHSSGSSTATAAMGRKPSRGALSRSGTMAALAATHAPAAGPAQRDLKRQMTSAFNGTSRAITVSMKSNWRVEEYISHRRSANQLTIRDRLYQAFESPASSTPSLLLAAFFLVASTMSVVIAGMQLSAESSEFEECAAKLNLGFGGNSALVDNLTSADVAAQCAPFFTGGSLLDWSFMVVFGLEVLVRFLVYVKPWTDCSLWGDIVCVVPLMLRLALYYADDVPIRVVTLDNPYRTFCILVQARAHDLSPLAALCCASLPPLARPAPFQLSGSTGFPDGICHKNKNKKNIPRLGGRSR